MAVEKQRFSAGAAGGNASGRRRLHMERLETRSVLSAAVFFPAPSVAADFHAAPPAIESRPLFAEASGAEFARPSVGFGGNVGAGDFAFQPGFAMPSGIDPGGPEIASRSGGFGDVRSGGPAWKPGFTMPFGINPGGPDIASPPDALGEAATQAEAVATPAGQGIVSLDGIGSTQYVKIDVTVTWEGGFPDDQSFVAPPTNDAVKADVLPSPRVETNLGIATPAAILAPLPANLSNGEAIANSATSVVATFQVAIASPSGTPMAVAAGAAPATELSGSTDAVGGEISPMSMNAASDSAEGGLLAIGDISAASMQLDRRAGMAVGADPASNLNSQEAAASALIGSTDVREGWTAINSTEQDGAFAEWQARAAAAAGPGAPGLPSAAGMDEGGGIELAAAACPAMIASSDSSAASRDAAATPLRLEPIRFDSAMGMFHDVEVATGGALRAPACPTSPPRASTRAMCRRLWPRLRSGSRVVSRPRGASWPCESCGSRAGPAGLLRRGALRSSAAGTGRPAARTPPSSRRKIAFCCKQAKMTQACLFGDG